MGTNNNLTQRYYQILISYAHDDDYLNAVHLLFQNLKTFGKECNSKVLLAKVILLLAQKWLEIIQNVIKEGKCFILLSSKKKIEKNRYLDENIPIIWKEFNEIKSSGRI
jgi:hypothetical protein